MAKVNPLFNAQGRRISALSQQFRSYKKQDPPPERVKPVPLQLLDSVIAQLTAQATQHTLAVLDLLILGFFFLLRPGEHTFAKNNNHPFRLCDVSFELPDQLTTNAAVSSLPSLATASRVHLNFTTQKNGVKNEAITHGSTSHPWLCPTKAVLRRVQHLRAHNCSPNTPLFTVFEGQSNSVVTSSHLTAALKTAAEAHPEVGIRRQDISARALRAGGAMALLRANVDPVHIRLLGRWKSWAMLTYLHRSASRTSDYASQMLAHGHYTIASHAFLPNDTLQHLHSLSADVTGALAQDGLEFSL